MRIRARWFSIGSVALAGSLVAPLGKDAFAATRETIPAAPAPAGGQAEGSGAAQRRGLPGLLDDALSEVDLKPDQVEAIDKLEDAIEEAQMAAGDAERNLMVGLADQIEAGGTDDGALKTQLDGVASAASNASRAVRSAFEGLHRILDAGQRGKFVDAMKKTMSSAAQPSPPSSALQNTGSPNAGFDAWAKDLGLSDDQKQRIQGVVQAPVAGPPPGSFDLAKVLDAFRGEDFVLDNVAPAQDVAGETLAIARQMVKTTLAIAQILTPAQRGTEAGRLRARLRPPSPERSGASTPSENTRPNIHLLRFVQAAWGADSRAEGLGLRPNDDFRHHRDRHRHERGWDRYYQSQSGRVPGWAYRGLSPYLGTWRGWASGYGYPYFGGFVW